MFKRMEVSDSVEIKIRKNDILDISVSCAEPELLQPFNNLLWGNNYSGNYGGGYNNRGYLVEQDGTINFPLLGKLKNTRIDPAPTDRVDSGQAEERGLYKKIRW